jgi:hypothetical protein
VKCAAGEYYQPTAGVCFSAKVVNPDTHQCGAAGYHKISEGSCESDDYQLPLSMGGGCIAGRHLGYTAKLQGIGCISNQASIYNNGVYSCVAGWHLDASGRSCVQDNPPTSAATQTGSTGGATGTTTTPMQSSTTGAGGTTTGAGAGNTATPIKIYPSTPPITTTPITCEKDKHPLEGKCVSSYYPNDDLTCMKGTHANQISSAYLGVICSSDIEPSRDSNANPIACPAGAHFDDAHNCLPDNLTPIQYCTGGTPILFNGKCYDHLPVIGGSTTGPGGGFIQMIPMKTDTAGTAGGPTTTGGTTSTPSTTSTGGTSGTPGTTTTTGGTTKTPTSTTQTGGTTGTTTTTGSPTTTPATTTTSPTTSTTSTTTNVINGGGSGGVTGGGGTSTTGAAAPAQGSNTFLTYVNAINKLTIKYPSSWTKTDLVGNPSIPVMFSAPTAIATATTPGAAATKTSFVISVTPSASNLDSFTQQQINALTNSKAIKYTITDTNAKVLTPPTGITSFREVSYDGMKSGNGVQVPLRGAAIFFVSGSTGYSLLYLAKQTEYTQNLPMVQQMVNSFQVGSSGGPVKNVAAASGSTR